MAQIGVAEWVAGLQAVHFSLSLSDSRALFHAVDAIEGGGDCVGVLTRREIAHLYNRVCTNSADVEEDNAEETKAAERRAAMKSEATRQQHAFTQLGSDEERMAWLRTELEQKGVSESTLMGAMDADRSGTVRVGEWVAGLQMVGISLEQADARKLFRAIDSVEGHGDGSLTLQELARLFGRMMTDVEARCAGAILLRDELVSSCVVLDGARIDIRCAERVQCAAVLQYCGGARGSTPGCG